MYTVTTISIYVYIITIIFIMLATYYNYYKSQNIDFTFPDGFLIGAGSSSYQIEGAWNEDNKSENIWDHFSHNFPEKIADRSNGDVSCDFYHKYKEDIKLMKDIGLNHYRFSLSWARILPTGYANSINKKALQFYHNILDELEKHEIQPFVTIYHWDHPQSLERLGGWTNELMVDLFVDYATVVFKEFGPRVKFFSTINEPYIYCKLGYQNAMFAPGLNLTSWGQYYCIHNMLKAHALSYHIYNDEFRSQQNGQIGIVIPCRYHYSKNVNDSVSNEIAFEFECGCTANPIFSEEGDYPKIIKKIIEDKSKLEGRRKSKLPIFSKEWVEYIKGTADYFGLNHYTTIMVESLPKGMNREEDDIDLFYTANSTWASSQSNWLKIVPEGFGDLLRKIKKKYNNPPVYILENGVTDANIVDDNTRIRYHHDYMKEMLIAMKKDKCNIKAYTIWSFTDSFEWNMGYVDHFGLVSVDFNDPNRTRTLKKSALWLKTVLKSRQLQHVV